MSVEISSGSEAIIPMFYGLFGTNVTSLTKPFSAVFMLIFYMYRDKYFTESIDIFMSLFTSNCVYFLSLKYIHHHTIFFEYSN
jgi:hypothetical protein